MINLAVNSWGIKKLILVALAWQLVMLILVGLGALGFEIPVLRQIVGFVYLSFVPGILILRVLRLQRLGIIETILYSVGLSVAFVMFTGCLVNILYPLFGISKPISLLPLLGTLTLALLIICAIAYIRERQAIEPTTQNPPFRWSDVLSPPALFLLILPIISVLGAFLVYLHKGNFLLLTLIPLIALTAILVAFSKFIPAKLYPLAIATISLSLLLPNLLISPSLSGFDIHHHYWIQGLVMSNAKWSPNVMHAMSNSMLSTTILTPFYSFVLNWDAVWIFKIVYGLFISLVPLALFQVYRQQIDDKIAFLGAFFFMSMPVFYSTTAGASVTQTIAEVFLALAILTLLTKKTDASITILCLVFSLAIVVSHYAVSYFYMGYLIIAWVLLQLWRRLFKPADSSTSRQTLDFQYVILFIVFCFGWYIYTSLGASFNTVIWMGDHIFSSIRTDLLLPTARDPQILQALGQAPMRGTEVTWEIARIVQYITQLFIITGIIGMLVSLRKTRIHPVYLAMTLVSILILGLVVILPYFTANLSMARAYHLTLFFLSPLCILGGKLIFGWLSKAFSQLRLQRLAARNYLCPVVLVALVPYLLFSSGFIFELAGNTPTSMSLSTYRADWGFFTAPEIRARDWIFALRDTKNSNFNIQGDSFGAGLLFEKFGYQATIVSVGSLEKNQKSFVFLRHWNITYGEMLAYQGMGAHVYPKYTNVTGGTELSHILQNKSKIYANGWAEILGPR